MTRRGGYFLTLRNRGSVFFVQGRSCNEQFKPARCKEKYKIKNWKSRSSEFLRIEKWRETVVWKLCCQNFVARNSATVQYHFYDNKAYADHVLFNSSANFTDYSWITWIALLPRWSLHFSFWNIYTGYKFHLYVYKLTCSKPEKPKLKNITMYNKLTASAGTVWDWSP